MPITMAFQPILDVEAGEIFAHEALLRAPDGRSPAAIMAEVDDTNRYAFDQRCRVTAIELGAALGIGRNGSLLSINFLPNAVYEPRACIRLTLETAERTGFPLDRIMFEFTEAEHLDTAHILNILQVYQSLGFKTAIDDFGCGYSGLSLLSKFQPDLVKLDMELIRNIDRDPVKRKMVRHILAMLNDLGVQTVCEGIESRAEFTVLRDMGVRMMQGYLFARPLVGKLASVDWPRPWGPPTVSGDPAH